MLEAFVRLPIVRLPRERIIEPTLK